MSLDALSDDLLLEAAEWVGTDTYIEGHHYVTDRGTKLLLPLVLCSRRLDRIATPVLYTTFVQTGEQALLTFLRLLTEKPEMGAHVKRSVALETGEPAHINMGTVSRQDLERCRLGLECLEHFQRNKSDWIWDLEDLEWHAVVSFLLLLLPYLKEIDIPSYRGRPQPGYIDTAIEYAAHQQLTHKSQHSLNHLKTISIAYYDLQFA
jgi:hypothetical protein